MVKAEMNKKRKHQMVEKISKNKHEFFEKANNGDYSKLKGKRKNKAKQGFTGKEEIKN